MRREPVNHHGRDGAEVEAAAGQAAGAAIGELRDDPDLRAVVQQGVDRANAGVSRPETIKRFRILAGPFQAGAELTPTGKGPQRLRAGQVRQRYRRPVRVTTSSASCSALRRYGAHGGHIPSTGVAARASLRRRRSQRPA